MASVGVIAGSGGQVDVWGIHEQLSPVSSATTYVLRFHVTAENV